MMNVQLMEKCPVMKVMEALAVMLVVSWEHVHLLSLMYPCTDNASESSLTMYRQLDNIRDIAETESMGVSSQGSLGYPSQDSHSDECDTSSLGTPGSHIDSDDNMDTSDVVDYGEMMMCD